MNFFEFGEAPESVQRNVSELSAIMAQRRKGDAAMMTKNDTERYLVLVYKDRAAREAVAVSLGLPLDERYVFGDAVSITLRESSSGADAQVAGARNVAASGREHAGSTG